MGSVSQIGWEWYSRLAQRTPVTLLTHIRNRPAMEAAGAPLGNSEVRYIDTEWIAGPLYRFASRLFPKSQHSVFLVSSLDYYFYDHDLCKQFKRNGAEPRWDIVHAVTPVSPSGATRLHKLGLPVVLGPWNGGLASPRAFPEIMREDSSWLYRVREAGRYLDRVFGTTRSAAAILTATRATDESIPAVNRDRCVRMLENAVNLDLFQPAAWDPAPSATQPLRILFVGRLVPFKGVSMLLDAVARIRNQFPVEVIIAGDGPLRGELEEHARALGIGELVQFKGALPLPDVASEMRRAHVFCLPSVRESGGAVVLEAMAASLPVIAVNYGGPAEIVSPEIGCALSCNGRDELVEELTEVLGDVVRNPGKWREKGLAGRRRAEQQYGWDAKVNTAVELYGRILRGERLHG
jgi:glycosyltransferase involved in cell wall biosynthesis